jgi:hypothetical protein
MIYRDFLWETGNFLENEIETNVKYSKKSILYLQTLWYIIDTYYLAKVCYNSTDDNLTLKIKSLAEYIAGELGGCDLDLPYIPHEHMFYWMCEPTHFEGFRSF